MLGCWSSLTAGSGVPNTEAYMGPSTPFSVLSMHWSRRWRKDRRARGPPHRDGLLAECGCSCRIDPIGDNVSKVRPIGITSGRSAGVSAISGLARPRINVPGQHDADITAELQNIWRRLWRPSYLRACSDSLSFLRFG